MKRIYTLVLILAAVFSTSCNTLMDSQQDDRVESEQSLYEYMSRAYFCMNKAFFPAVFVGVSYGTGAGGEMLAGFCDEAQAVDRYGKAYSWYNGAVSAEDMPLFNAVSGEKTWEYLFNGIDRCNTALYYLNKEDLNPEYDQETRDMFISQYHALTALNYLYLIKRWGGVPVITEPLSSDYDFSKDERASFAQCVDHIIAECDAAEAADQTLGWFNGAPRYCPKICLSALAAIRSQAALYAASPLWAEDYAGTEKYTWERAAAITRKSLKDVIDHRGRLVGAETTFPQESENGYGPYDKYFLSAYPWTFSWDTETLLQPYVYGLCQSVLWESNGLPLDPGQRSAGACPTQEMVDAYDVVSADGTKAVPLLVLSKPYNEDGTPNFNPEALALGYEDCSEKMYQNRDPRFYGTIYFDGSTTVRNSEIVTISTREGGNCGISDMPTNKRNTVTGYYLRKFINADSGADNGNKDGYLRQFRLAELYLNFAEAAFMAYGPDTEVDGMTAREAVNTVRARVGLPGITESGEEFLLRLKNERRVELAFEEHRFYDVRRWSEPGESLEATDRRVSGMRITEDGKYERIYFERNSYAPKYLKLPLPLDEVRKMLEHTGKDWQNEGWN